MTETAPQLLTVRIPMVPASCLLPNAQRRLSHHVWGPEAAWLRTVTSCYAILTRWTDPPVTTAPVSLTCTIAWPRGRKKVDFGGAVHALKAAVDGLEDAGWMANDRQVVAMAIIQHRADPLDRSGWTEIAMAEALL